MTEAEWAACRDPEKLFGLLRKVGPPTNRKLRLFAAACCRRSGNLLTHPSLWDAIETAERYADGQASYAEMVQAAKAVEAIAASATGAAAAISRGIWHLVTMGVWWNLWPARRTARTVLALLGADGASGSLFPALFRCIMGPPRSRPVPLGDASWLTPDGFALAKRAYDERILPTGTLAPAHLAALAAALEAAGCTDAPLLTHLSSPGPHVRGCHGLDLLLSRE